MKSGSLQPEEERQTVYLYIMHAKHSVSRPFSRTVRLLVLVMLPVIAFRSATPLLHTHSHSDKAEIASYCIACDLDATTVDHVSNAAVLPASPLVAMVHDEFILNGIVVSVFRDRSGRSPPALPIA